MVLSRNRLKPRAQSFFYPKFASDKGTPCLIEKGSWSQKPETNREDGAFLPLKNDLEDHQWDQGPPRSPLPLFEI